MYLYEQDLAINNLQGMICQNRKPTNQPINPNFLNCSSRN